MIYFNKEKEAFSFEIPNYICSITDELWADYAGTDKWDIVNGEFIDITNTPEYIAKKEQEREAQFNKEFFGTTLGYVRRSVTMRDGNKKDFLSDLLSAISAGVQGGMEVRIILYNKPPFTQDVEDWTQYQHVETADAQFVSECMQQLQADFGVLNQGVE